MHNQQMKFCTFFSSPNMFVKIQNNPHLKHVHVCLCRYIYLSIYIYMCLLLSKCIIGYIRPCTSLSLSLYLSIYHLSIYLSICVYMYNCPYMYLSVNIYLLYLSVCHSVYPFCACVLPILYCLVLISVNIDHIIICCVILYLY